MVSEPLIRRFTSIKFLNMRTIGYLLLLATLGSFYISCEFEPHGENFITLEKPDSTRTIELLELSPFQNTYIITVPTWVRYDLNTFGLTILEVEVFVGDESIFKSDSPTGGFTFLPERWEIGIHPMSMVVTTNSNTGSIADLLHAEGHQYKLEWQLYLDGHSPGPVEITNIFNDDGILKVEWGKYERLNFQKYILYKNFSDDEPPYVSWPVAEIDDPMVTSWYDSSYVGGTGIYWVEVQASNNKATGAKKRFEHDYPKVDTLWQRNDSALFVWSKNQFPKALQNTHISLKEKWAFDPEYIFVTENPNDTSFLAAGLRFGVKLEYVLGFQPMKDMPVYKDGHMLKSTISFAIGKPFPLYKRIKSSDNGDILYVEDDNSISKMTVPEMKILSSHETDVFRNWFISPDGKLMASARFNILYKHDPDNIGITKILEAEDYGWNYIGRSMSNAGLTMVDRFPEAAMLDLINEKIIWTSSDNGLGSAAISPDGNYLFKRLYNNDSSLPGIQLYKFNGTEPLLIKELFENNLIAIFWDKTEEHKLVFITEDYTYGFPSDKIVKIFDAVTLKTEVDFRLQKQYFVHLNTQKDILVASENDKSLNSYKYLNIYRLSTHELIGSINLAQGFDYLDFHGTRVFSGQGYYLDISKLKEYADL